MPGDFSTFREPPASDAGDVNDTEFLLQDHQGLVDMLMEERKRRVEAELRRKEAEDDRYAMERAQQEPGDRYVPVAITPDLLARTISESMRQATKGGAHHRYHIRMPTPGCTGAPETFTGASGKLLPEFFRRFELSLAEAEISDDEEMLNHLLKYVGVTVGEWIQNQPSFKRGHYEGLKNELLTLYGNPEKGDPYTVKDLTVLAMEYARSEVTSQDALSERLMVFDTMASKLIAAKKLNEVDRDQLYFKTFTVGRREAIWEHLSKTEPWHPRKEPFSMRQVCKAAKYLIEGRFDDDIEGDPRPTGQRLLDELKRVKETKGDESDKKSEDLYDVIRKMKNLSIQDPIYETHYTYLCRFYPEAARIMSKPIALAPPAENPMYGSKEYRPAPPNVDRPDWRTDWPRNKCFYCAEDGCSMSRCAALTTDIKDGLVLKEGQSLTYRDGGRLFRKDNGIRQDVLARRAREVAERNASKVPRDGKDIPPHQTNVYQLYEGDEEEFRGFYIGIQEVPKKDGGEVNSYTVDEEEEETVARAESYYLEMINDGYSDEDATQRAWVMATTRQEGRARTARESAKPYEKDRAKGKDKVVRFQNEIPPVREERYPPRPIPAPRFPPSTPMPAQPVSVPKPATEDWPRPPTPKLPSVATANPAVASTSTPTSLRPIKPYPTVETPKTIPEIDMTTGKPVPKYRFTSEVEDQVDVEKTMDEILASVKLSVSLVDLLALSPAMRKHLAEMTKTKRVPTTDVARPKKVLALREEQEEEVLYLSMPVIEASNRSPRYSGALPRIQAEINGTPAVGMLDTGSQINLMTEEYWMKTGLPINEGRKIRMQGVNLTGDQSMGLCEHVEVPFAGVTTRAHFHVFKKGPYPFILGQPWIQDHLIAVTETGHTNKILIRDFRDPKSRVTMILRNDESTDRGDMPTVVEMSMPPTVELTAYVGIVEDCAVEPELFEELEESLAMEDEKEIRCIDALTGETEYRPASFRRPL
jgi:Aspartyl protease